MIGWAERALFKGMWVQFVQVKGGEGMRRQLTWRQYRAIDLTLMAAALAIFEFIIVRAANWWFPGQPFTVSLAAPVASIVYMRWGWWGAIHAALAGLVWLFSAHLKNGTEPVLMKYGIRLGAALLLADGEAERHCAPDDEEAAQERHAS